VTSGLAMKMRVELAQLAHRHGTVPPISCALPLAPATAYPLSIVGVAVSNSVDQVRTRFRPWCPTFMPKPPPLLFRHQDPAGEIESIEHDQKGRLIIRARVDHPEARRCRGLSVCATIEAYQLMDVDDPLKFHALITRPYVDEVSADCLITSRIPDCPTNKFFDLAQAGVGKMIEIVDLLKKVNERPRVQRTEKREPRFSDRAPRSQTIRRQTSFSSLVDQLKEMNP
jgi:hypothetical protein